RFYRGCLRRGKEAADGRDGSIRPYRLNLYPPRHQQPEGNWLRVLQRERRPDANNLARFYARYGLVLRVPPRPRRARAPERQDLRHGFRPAEPAPRGTAASPRRVRRRKPDRLPRVSSLKRSLKREQGRIHARER